MKILYSFCIVIFIVLIKCSLVQAQILMLNPLILGEPVDSPTTILKKENSFIGKDVGPLRVDLIPKGGVYEIASVAYSVEDVSFDEMRTEIDKKYKQYKIEEVSKEKYAAWIIKDKKYLMFLSTISENGPLQIIYSGIEEKYMNQ